MPNPLRREHQKKKAELEKARALAERLQHDDAYYDMAARLTTAKKSLSLLQVRWKRFQTIKNRLPKNSRTQKKEKNIDLEATQVETEIEAMHGRIEQITDILKSLEKPLD